MTTPERDGGRGDAPPVDAETGAVPVEVHFEDEEIQIRDIGWIDAPGILAFWALAVVVFLQFFTRYVLNDSLAWTEEVARYILILVCFLGSVSAMKRGSHIMLEFFIRALRPAWGKALAVFAEAVTLVFLCWITWIGIELIQKTRQKMVTIPVPKSWIYMLVVAGLALMALYSARWLWRKWRARPDEVVRFFDPSTKTD